MYDALETSGGKAAMRLLLIGTRAPAAEGNWWRSLPAVADAIGGRASWATRRTRWSEITQDIGACRKLGHDGGLTVTPESRRAFRMALSETEVEGDDDGNVRLTKRRRGRSRDDLCVALVMAAGAMLPYRVQRAGAVAGDAS